MGSSERSLSEEHILEFQVEISLTALLAPWSTVFCAVIVGGLKLKSNQIGQLCVHNTCILHTNNAIYCQEAFAKFDTKRRGLVSTKVLGDLLRQIGINPTKEELQVLKSTKCIPFVCEC